MFRILVAVLLLLAAAPDFAQAQLRGHGGPVRALAISPDGTQAISGSFDTSVIRWSLQRNAAEQVLRFHDGAVNAAVFLPGRPDCDQRRGCPHRDLAAGRGAAVDGARRTQGAGGRARRIA